jgi:transposase
MNEIKVLGIDLGKDVCSVVGFDGAGKVLLRRRMRHDSILKMASGMPPCVMAMEACCGAIILADCFASRGTMCG